MAYKVKQNIVQFIIDSKHANPKISCRGLVDLIKLHLGAEVSKSSINSVIKEHNLSSHVGRTRIREAVSKPKELKQNIKGVLSKVDKNLFLSEKEKKLVLDNDKKEELFLSSRINQDNPLLTFDPVKPEQNSKKVIYLKSEQENIPPIESKGCNYLVDNVLDSKVGKEKVVDKTNKPKSWANRWLLQDEEINKDETEYKDIFKGKLFKTNSLKESEEVKKIDAEVKKDDNLDKIKEDILNKTKEKEEVKHFALSSESLVEEEKKLELEEQIPSENQDQDKEKLLELYSQSIVNKEHTDSIDEEKTEFKELEPVEKVVEEAKIEEVEPVKAQETLKEEVLPVSSENVIKDDYVPLDASVEPKEAVVEDLAKKEPLPEVPVEVKKEELEEEKKDDTISILETKSYSDFVKEKLYKLKDDTISSREISISSEEDSVPFVKDNETDSLLNERNGILKRNDSAWPDPKFEVPLEEKPKPGQVSNNLKEDLNWKIEDNTNTSFTSAVAYPKFIKNGGVFFLKAADFAINMVGQLSEKFVGYLPELDFEQRKAFLQQVIYSQYVKDYLSLKAFVDRNLPDDIVNKYKEEMIKSEFISIKDDLIKMKLYNNINSLNDLTQQVLYFLNGYVQDKFFPSIYHYLDAKAMFERFYCVSAMIENTTDELNVKFYYPQDLVWASDIIWLEDFSNAAKAVNNARIFSPDGKKVIFNPTIECLT